MRLQRGRRRRAHMLWAAPAPRTMTVMAAVLVALTATLASCTSGGAAFNGPPVQHVGTPVTYLAVIDLLAVPPEDASPLFAQALLSQAFPPWATSYEAVATNGTDAFAALTRSAALARSVHPTVVAVSEGMTALFRGVASSQFASALGELLAQLRGSGATTILVGNLVPADLSASADACLSRTSCDLAPDGATWTEAALANEITAYNDAIAIEAASHGAVLVDLHGALEKAIDRRGAGAVWSSSSYSLTVYGSGLVADAFLQAIRHRPLNAHGALAT